MASCGTVQRPSTTSTTPPPPTSTDDLNQRKDSTGKKCNDFKLFCLLNIPATPEATAVRIIRYFSYYRLHYTLFIVTILSITLVPQRKDSLIFLRVMTAVGCLYLVLLWVVHESLLGHKTIERQVVLALINTVQRPSTTTTPPPPPTTTDDLNQGKDSTGKKRNDFKLFCLFNVPATPEATAVRIVRNFSYFGLYYTIFILTILSITLVPQHKDSLIFLTVVTAVGCLYLVLLRVVPESLLVHNTVERQAMLALLAIGTMIELILTDAAVNLFVTLASVIPVILVHAVFRVRDDVFVEEAGGFGEFVPLTTTDEPKLSDSV